MLSTTHLAMLAELAPLAMLSVHQDGHIQWANERAGQLLGAASDKLVGRPVLDIYAPGPEGKQRAHVLFQRFLAGEMLIHEPVLLLRTDGHVLRALLDVRSVQVPGSDRQMSVSVLRTHPTVESKEGIFTARGESVTSRLLARQQELALEHQVRTNVEQLLQPLVSRARTTADARTRALLDALDKALDHITEPFGAELARRAPSLTPREIEICALVRSGLASKEIGAILGISHRSVEAHRTSTRRKLGITDPRVRLASFLAGSTFDTGG